jgi:hypothetical protein
VVKVRGLPASDEDHPLSHLDHPSSLSAGQWRPHYRVLGYRTSAIPSVRTRRRHRGRGHRSAVPQCLQPLQWLHSARGYSGERRRDRRPGRTASTTIPTNTSLQLPLPTIADQPSRLAGGDVAGHRLAVQNRQPLDHPDALPGQPQRNTSRTSNTRTSRNAIAASEPRSRGTAARAPSPGPALVVPGRWSHHWRWDGPMPLAQLSSRRSHTAGGRHALTRLLGSSSAGGIRSRGDGRVVSQHGMTCSCWLGRPLPCSPCRVIMAVARWPWIVATVHNVVPSLPSTPDRSKPWSWPCRSWWTCGRSQCRRRISSAQRQQPDRRRRHLR